VHQNEAHLLDRERPELMGEADARVELRIPRQPLLQAGHPDQHQADVFAVIDVPQLFQPRHLQPVRLVDDQQGGIALGRQVESLGIGVQRFLDQDIEAAKQGVEVFVNPPRRIAERRRIEDGAIGQRLDREHWHRDGMPHRHEGGRDLRPSGILPRGERLTDTGRSIAEADIPLATAHVAELGEAPVFLGDDELCLTH
jgi:hypothetical protein